MLTNRNPPHAIVTTIESLNNWDFFVEDLELFLYIIYYYIYTISFVRGCHLKVQPLGGLKMSQSGLDRIVGVWLQIWNVIK